MLGIMKLILAVAYIFVIRIFLKLDKEMQENAIWKYMNNLDEDWKYYAIAVIFIVINMLFL